MEPRTSWLPSQASLFEAMPPGLELREDFITVPEEQSDEIRAHAFGANPLFEAWVAQEKGGGGHPLVAHALATRSYDVRRGCPSMVLCELYVVPSHRRGGLARKLMSTVARRARALGARELTITTGVGNEVAQRFFAAVGAHPRQAAVFMMSADGIEWLAAEGL